jgi:hypothetical protein
LQSSNVEERAIAKTLTNMRQVAAIDVARLARVLGGRATQGLDKEPLEYHAGDHFRIDYLVLVYPSVHSPAQIERRYQSWAKELK